MSIVFDETRWGQVRTNYTRWWAGELQRPLLALTVTGCPSDRPGPAQPPRKFLSFHDPSVPADDVIDALDDQLSRQRFLGDAFPSTWLNFGAGVLAVAVGDAELFNGEDTVWFRARRARLPAKISFAFDPEAPWFRRIADLAAAAGRRWQGRVQVGMTDLGGALDVLSTYRPGEDLLLDLYDHPEEIRRLIGEIHAAWWQAFDRLNAVLRPPNPGYTAWTPIFSSEPYYMLQCDFAYMIGPEMFRTFVLPELAASCRRLKNAFYHLDGVGQLPHLDAILSIPELKGVQWIPGDGKPGMRHWPEVYRRIRAAGKLIQIFGDLDTLDAIAGQLGSARGIILIGTVQRKAEDRVRERMQPYMRET